MLSRLKGTFELPAVSLVVLNFNGREHLEACLGSVVAVEYPKDRLEVLLCDNGSSDGSVGYVKERFPGVRVVALDRNYGFAEGNNRAAAQATHPWVGFLNNDMRVEPSWLRNLVEPLAEQEDAARDPEDRDEIERHGGDRGRDLAQRGQVEPVRQRVVQDAGRDGPGPTGRRQADRPDPTPRKPRRGTRGTVAESNHVPRPVRTDSWPGAASATPCAAHPRNAAPHPPDALAPWGRRLRHLW